MGTGYVRNDTANNIADGNVIDAADLDGEFDALQSAFNNSTGHTHDGTAAEGAPIEVIGPAQDFVAGASSLSPKADDTYDLGTTLLKWKDLYIDGTADLDDLVVNTTATFAGATIADLGTVTTADIDGGAIDGTPIGANSASTGAFTTLTASGAITFADNDFTLQDNLDATKQLQFQLSGITTSTTRTLTIPDADTTLVGTDTTQTLTNKTLTSPDINGGTVDSAVIGGSSAAAGTFTDLTASGSVSLAATGANSITVSGTATFNGNTVIGNAATDTVTVTADVASDLIPSADATYDLGASGSEWQDLWITGTANIDSLVADTADINGGSIDGATIGANSAAAGSFTTLDASGDVAFDTSGFFFDQSAGYVGIGTASLSAALHIEQSAINSFVFLNDSGGVVTDLIMADTSGSVRLRENAGSLLVQVGGAANDVAATGASTIADFNSGGLIEFNSGGDFAVNTDVFYVEAATGQVGVNVSSPDSPLHVFTDAGTGVRVQRWQVDLGTNTRTADLLVPEADSLSDPFIFYTNNSWLFRVDTTDAFQIDDNGEVQVDNGYGSLETFYGVRAWGDITWDGIANTDTTNGSGNVASVTHPATPNRVTINFTNAMPDANYSVAVSTEFSGFGSIVSKATGSVTLEFWDTSGSSVTSGDFNFQVVR